MYKVCKVKFKRCLNQDLHLMIKMQFKKYDNLLFAHGLNLLRQILIAYPFIMQLLEAMA